MMAILIGIALVLLFLRQVVPLHKALTGVMSMVVAALALDFKLYTVIHAVRFTTLDIPLLLEWRLTRRTP